MRSTSYAVACLLLAAALSACTPEPAPPAVAADTPAPSPRVTPWALPVVDGAAQPDLVALPDGALLLSWIEARGEGHVLRLARFADGRWSDPVQVAEGGDWFVNWADTPHVQATPDGALWAHWLRRSTGAPYAYDVMLSRSADGGASWATPVAVNTDARPAEHGFVSMWPVGADSLGVAWLDGRDNADDSDGGHGGATMLRGAVFDALLGRHGERVIDASVCDCCRTDAAPTRNGAVLAWRDRDDGEIRDIQVARFDGERWQVPRMVHRDGWRMPACPVNGPAIDADGDDVVVAWYTAAGGEPSVRVARSTDAGDSFSAPVRIDQGDAVLGRVDVALANGRPWATWLREEGDGQSLWLARLARDASAVDARLQVASLRGRGHGAGLPRLAARGDQLHLVWTEVSGARPRLQGATVALR